MGSENNERPGILLEQGTGEFEMLVFSVGKETFATNVAKVKELIRIEKITKVPNADDRIIGIFKPRDELISAIDLSKCLYNTENEAVALIKKGLDNLTVDEKRLLEERIFVICSFNKTSQAWLIDKPKGIYRVPWSEIIPPSTVTGEESLITGICKLDGELIQIIDFESILTKICPEQGLTISSLDKISTEDVDKVAKQNIHAYIADDSAMLNKLISTSLEKAGYKVSSFPDGKKLYEALLNLKEKDNLSDCDIVITDIEMPQIDGTQLCKMIKQGHDKEMAKIPVLMFSSLIDGPMIEKCKSVGANGGFSKPEIDKVVTAIPQVLNDLKNGKADFFVK